MKKIIFFLVCFALHNQLFSGANLKKMKSTEAASHITGTTSQKEHAAAINSLKIFCNLAGNDIYTLWEILGQKNRLDLAGTLLDLIEQQPAKKNIFQKLLSYELGHSYETNMLRLLFSKKITILGSHIEQALTHPNPTALLALSQFDTFQHSTCTSAHAINNLKKIYIQALEKNETTLALYCAQKLIQIAMTLPEKNRADINDIVTIAQKYKSGITEYLNNLLNKLCQEALLENSPDKAQKIFASGFIPTKSLCEQNLYHNDQNIRSFFIQHAENLQLSENLIDE